MEEYSFDEFYTEELKVIKLSREQRIPEHPEAPLAGIGLSGGGIRSACLALGVLQALSSKNLLRRFDYISTVSGGGYIGSSLQWWWGPKSREDSAQTSPFGLGNDFPYAAELDPASMNSGNRPLLNLQFLRSHASYLTPGNGLTAWSMVVVLLRTVLTSLLIWLPLLTLAFGLIHFLSDQVLHSFLTSNLWSPLDGLIKTTWSYDPAACKDTPECIYSLRPIYAVSLYVFYGIAAVFVWLGVVYTLLSRAPQETDSPLRLKFTTVASLIVLAGAAFYISWHYSDLDSTAVIILFLLIGPSVVLLFRILAEHFTEPSLNASYWLRRNLETILGRLFLVWLAFGVFGLIPVLPYYLKFGWAAVSTHIAASPLPVSSAQSTATGVAGFFTLLSGVFSALYGYYTFVRSIVPSLASRIAATLGSLIYLLGTIILAYWLSIVVVSEPQLILSSKEIVQSVAVCLVITAVAMALRANVNYVGLHRFYRDRLMEAFMPRDKAVDEEKSDYSPVADKLSITDLGWSLLPCRANFAPYPLINTNAIMIRDKDPKTAGRGGVNFLISPLFVGSSATGWVESDEYIRQTGPLTLATAMAASGAAASANAGYIGTGLTMNPFVSIVMSLLNIRLGVWVGNPWRLLLASTNRGAGGGVKGWLKRAFYRIKNTVKSQRVSPRIIPTFISPGLTATILGRGYRRTSKFLELTDGGHFENLAVYELVRRKLPLILIVDGEADPAINLASLVSARNRVEQDFGARICFEDGRGPELLVMYAERGYPGNVKYAQSPFIVGKIHYADGSSGTLIYIKSNIIPNLDFAISGYLASNPDFPHQTTADQFFSPDQFEAYRKLGEQTASSMIKDLELEKNIGLPDSIRDAFDKIRFKSTPIELDGMIS